MVSFDSEDLSGPKVDRRTVTKLFAAGGLSTSLAGCTGGDEQGAGNDNMDEDSPAGQTGGEIEAGWLIDQINHLDPHFVNRGEQMGIQHNIHAGLVRLDDEGNIIGEIAEDWDIPDDNTYRFHLVEDAEFHNGDPVDAEAVKWSMDRLTELSESPHVGKVDTLETVEIIDDTTVEMRLDEPLAPFLAFLTNAPGRAGAIVNRSAVEDDDIDYDFMPVGAGPFELVDRTPGESLTLEAFDNYFETDADGTQLPYLDRIEISLIPEPSTMWSAFETGSIQFAQELPAQQAGLADDRPEIDVVGTDTGYISMSYLAIDPQEQPEWAVVAGNAETTDAVTDVWQDRDIPTRDARVRRAMAMAIDREDVVERGLRGWGLPAHSIWQPSVGLTYEEEPDPGQYYDPERARELLDDAGYTGDPRFEADILVQPGNQERVATVLQDHFANVGIDINVDVRQPAGYWEGYYNYEYMLALGGSVTNIDPWMCWFRQLTTPTGEGSMGQWQKGLWSNEEFDELLLESRSTPDPDERIEIIREAEEIMIEEAPYAMVYFPLRPVGLSNDLGNVQLPTGLSNFHYATLDQ